MSKSSNPYKENSLYGKLMAHVIGKCKGIITKSALLKHATGKLKRTKGSAAAAVGVVLSPREKGTTNGDCRGNFSAAGDVYFMHPLAKKEGEEQRFRFRIRKTAMKPHTRPEAEVKQTKAKTKAKGRKKITAKSRKVATA